MLELLRSRPGVVATAAGGGAAVVVAAVTATVAAAAPGVAPAARNWPYIPGDVAIWGRCSKGVLQCFETQWAFRPGTYN